MPHSHFIVDCLFHKFDIKVQAYPYHGSKSMTCYGAMKHGYRHGHADTANNLRKSLNSV